MENWSGLGVVFACCTCGLLAAIVLVWLAIRWVDKT